MKVEWIGAVDVAQLIECLPNKLEAQDSIPSTT